MGTVIILKKYYWSWDFWKWEREKEIQDNKHNNDCNLYRLVTIKKLFFFNFKFGCPNSALKLKLLQAFISNISEIWASRVGSHKLCEHLTQSLTFLCLSLCLSLCHSSHQSTSLLHLEWRSLIGSHYWGKAVAQNSFYFAGLRATLLLPDGDRDVPAVIRT
jgi:hypothetical protein